MSQHVTKIEQAIFTSCQATDNEGYQLAATSAGITAAIAKELTAWGPTHDSLCPGCERFGSVSAFPLADGGTCLALSRLDQPEYSGRGIRTVTWMLIIDAAGLAQFGNHPLRVLDAAIASSWPPNAEATQLETLELTGSGRAVNSETVARITRSFGAIGLTSILHQIMRRKHLGLVTTQQRLLLVDAILSALPLSQRALVSFTTGLTPSLKRPFRLHLLPSDPAEARNFERLFHGHVLDLTQPALAADLPRGQPWAQLLGLLDGEHWCELGRLICSPNYRMDVA